MNRLEFREALLRVVERKQHPLDEALLTGRLSPEGVREMLVQDYLAWIRDYGRLLSYASAQCPLEKVRAEMARDVYEVETGQLTETEPHASLYRALLEALGVSRPVLGSCGLLPSTEVFQSLLRSNSGRHGWAIGVATSSLFLPAMPWERNLFDPAVASPDYSDRAHPLVRFYGVDPKALKFFHLRRKTLRGRRKVAWHLVTDFVEDAERGRVVGELGQLLHGWRDYRDALAVRIERMDKRAA